MPWFDQKVWKTMSTLIGKTGGPKTRNGPGYATSVQTSVHEH